MDYDSSLTRALLALLILALIWAIALLMQDTNENDTIPNWRKRQYGEGKSKENETSEADETDNPRYR